MRAAVIAFLFPGQGAQRPGFLGALPAHPAVDATLEEARDALGLEGELDSRESLRSTVGVQLGLLIAATAATRALRAEGFAPDAVAGLSIGSFGAAVTAGALAFHDALALAQLRAHYMEAAYPKGYGMAAISGLTEDELAHRIRDVFADADDTAYIANINAPRQIVVAGSDAALETLMASVLGHGARKVHKLDVAVPSHCALLAPAAARLALDAAHAPFADPRVPYVDNLGGRARYAAAEVREDLAQNIAHPVRWHDATQVLYELGVRLFIEMPPGRALSDLIADAFPDARALPMDGTPWESIASALRHAAR